MAKPALDDTQNTKTSSSASFAVRGGIRVDVQAFKTAGARETRDLETCLLNTLLPSNPFCSVTTEPPQEKSERSCLLKTPFPWA